MDAQASTCRRRLSDIVLATAKAALELLQPLKRLRLPHLLRRHDTFISHRRSAIRFDFGQADCETRGDLFVQRTDIRRKRRNGADLAVSP
ncbi:hypothetical protein [Paraburkholderia sp. BL6669N2]|uniref:hypothetical protein n=1 Tax=Paraburkholderia sp. BL6669N2 TaxID=1938807 RepID=UPI000E262E49|nr:hypothetical protein [Paraburkholderia sp. BL6669N2]